MKTKLIAIIIVLVSMNYFAYSQVYFGFGGGLSYFTKHKINSTTLPNWSLQKTSFEEIEEPIEHAFLEVNLSYKKASNNFMFSVQSRSINYSYVLFNNTTLSGFGSGHGTDHGLAYQLTYGRALVSNSITILPFIGVGFFDGFENEGYGYGGSSLQSGTSTIMILDTSFSSPKNAVYIPGGLNYVISFSRALKVFLKAEYHLNLSGYAARESVRYFVTENGQPLGTGTGYIDQRHNIGISVGVCINPFLKRDDNNQKAERRKRPKRKIQNG